jgi:hypothetical protein
MTPPTDSGSVLDKLRQQSAWYGAGARRNQSRYIALKSTQIILAAAIPVVAVAAVGATLRWTTAILGALIGIIEGIIQLGQYQQNWLLYRATREALKREDFLHEAKAGPYAAATDADTLYVERADAIISGENTKWITSQQQAVVKK